MTTNKFIKTLKYFYDNPIGDRYYCRWVLNNSTCSYELHDSTKMCFTKESLVYTSEVFWWGTKDENRRIIEDILLQASKL